MTNVRQHLIANNRTLLGRQVKSLREAGQLPANIFSKGNPSSAITINAKEFDRVYREAGETALIDLTIQEEGVVRPVLIRNADLHPVTGSVLHVDFQQVNLKEKITAMIPVETIGESEGMKAGAVLVMAHNEIEVEALPTDLPEKFEVDLSKLTTIGDDIKVSDLAVDRAKVEILLEDGEVIATLQAQEEEVAEEVVTEPVEVELTKQGATKDVPEAGEVSSQAPEVKKED